MLSSTSKDLPDHREAAAHSASRAGFFVIKMEELGARAGEDALSVSLAMVEEAEVYVGIFGQRYGFRPKDPERNPDDLSITELEYRRAVELGMPILVFMMHDDHPAPDTNGLKAAEAKKRMDDFFEPDPIGQNKLAAFKQTLMNNNIVAFFKSADELKDLVLHALMQDDLKTKARAYQTKRDAESAPDGTPPRPDSRTVAPPALRFTEKGLTQDNQKTVFVSYRRAMSRYVARAIYQDLKAHGWDVFLDINTIDSGDFDRIILNQIAARAHFILLISPDSLQRCMAILI
jgi:hypothetical protein